VQGFLSKLRNRSPMVRADPIRQIIKSLTHELIIYPLYLDPGSP